MGTLHLGLGLGFDNETKLLTLDLVSLFIPEKFPADRICIFIVTNGSAAEILLQ